MGDAPYGRTDPEVEAYRVRLAAEHQAQSLPGLSDDRLRVVRARLLTDADNAVTRARLDVVEEELRNRGVP